MIGGYDIVVPHAPHQRAAFFIICYLRTRWPELVVQRADDADALPFDDEHEAAICGSREFFVYATREAFGWWQTNGAATEYEDTMVHVMLGAESTTIVTSGPGSFTHKRGLELRTMLVALSA